MPFIHNVPAEYIDEICSQWEIQISKLCSSSSPKELRTYWWSQSQQRKTDFRERREWSINTLPTLLTRHEELRRGSFSKLSLVLSQVGPEVWGITLSATVDSVAPDVLLELTLSSNVEKGTLGPFVVGFVSLDTKVITATPTETDDFSTSVTVEALGSQPVSAFGLAEIREEIS